ncbi:MAG: ATP-binding protein [Chryseolinea sp.]
MYLQVTLSIIIISYLRKILRRNNDLLKWDKVLLGGIAVSISLIVISFAISESKPFMLWLSHLILLGIIYLIYSRREFHQTKPLVVAMFPLIIVQLIDDLTEVIDPKFHETWENVFETASLFALIWLCAFWFITNRQRKVLEQERVKAEAREKEYRITENIKAELEVQVAERTAALTAQKEELQKAIEELKSTQAQLIQSEKMASLCELTAGIAHEIQNPLNFVNNFSDLSNELIAEMVEEVKKGNISEAEALANDIRQNLEKINHHGKRADAIVKGMLQHSRNNTGAKEHTDINALTDEHIRMCYHGLRAKDKSFNATIKTDFDASLKKTSVIPQDIGRVILNLLSNAFYAVDEKKKFLNGVPTADKLGFEPTVSVSTRQLVDAVEIRVTDNGNGIPNHITDKIFQPFFTTKPTGQGTGLGLSLSYDIITKGHGGELELETTEGEGSTFIIRLVRF